MMFLGTLPIHRYAIIFHRNAYPPLSGIKGESLLKLSQLFLIERAQEKKKKKRWKRR
jgi:hypothetical protein